MANHVIFVSPPYTATKQKSTSVITQCVGRVIRFGQQHDVFIYTFATLGTYEIDILQSHYASRLIETAGGYALKNAKTLTKEEKRMQLGTGYEKPLEQWSFM